MKKKILIFSLVLSIVLVGGFFYILHLMFVGFEHRESYNGVGWGQFSKNLKTEIKATGFQASDFGHYEGTVWFGDLVNEHQSIRLGMFSRSSYADPRNLNTLKHGQINQIGGKSIFCFDDMGHEQFATISIMNMKFDDALTSVSSITEILDNYQEIEETVSNYEGRTYLVNTDGNIIDLPNWLYVNIRHNNCLGENHVVQRLTCRADVIN